VKSEESVNKKKQARATHFRKTKKPLSTVTVTVPVTLTATFTVSVTVTLSVTVTTVAAVRCLLLSS
jgi:hypothetical protein